VYIELNPLLKTSSNTTKEGKKLYIKISFMRASTCVLVVEETHSEKSNGNRGKRNIKESERKKKPEERTL
jgi:hypothetical protein